MAENKELIEKYTEAYKTTGPLKCNLITFNIKLKNDICIHIHLEHKYSYQNHTHEYEIFTDFPVETMYELFEYFINNDHIDKKLVNSWFMRMNDYNAWLHLTYKPKWGHLEQFFYQVYLWIKEDLLLFCNYTDLSLEEELGFPKDDNYNTICETLVNKIK